MSTTPTILNYCCWVLYDQDGWPYELDHIPHHASEQQARTWAEHELTQQTAEWEPGEPALPRLMPYPLASPCVLAPHCWQCGDVFGESDEIVHYPSTQDVLWCVEASTWWRNDDDTVMCQSCLLQLGVQLDPLDASRRWARMRTEETQ